MKTPSAPPHALEKPHHPHWPLAVLLFAFVFALGLRSIHEPSTWIRVRTGRRILAEGVLPRTETFSYGAAGAPWTTPSWLTDAAFAKLDAAGGAELVTAVKSAAVALGFALLLPINHGSPIVAASLLSIGACAAWAGLAEVPAAFDFLFFALFVRLLRPRRRFQWMDGAAAAGLTVLWANMHGPSAPLALWLVSLKVFKTSLRTAARERFGYWAMLLACVIVFAWNPHGYRLLEHVFADAGSGAAAWRTPLFSPYGVLLAAGLACSLVTLQQEFVTTLACATVLGLSVELPGLRPLGALAAAPLIALAAGHALKPREDTWPRVLRWAVLALGLFALYRETVSRPLAPTGGYGAPALSGAVHFLSENNVRGRMFNEPQTGAELIGTTERPVFSDLRQALYTESFRREALTWPGSFRALDGVYRFDYAVLRNKRALAPARALDENAEWKLAYADDRALVYLKKTGANAWLVAQSPFKRVAPNRLWPGELDAALAKPRDAAQVLEELDRWAVLAPDCAQALLWKAHALARLKLNDKADRLLDLARERPALEWNPELQAQAAYVLEERGRAEDAKRLYRRAARAARNLGDPSLEAAVNDRLQKLGAPVPAL